MSDAAKRKIDLLENKVSYLENALREKSADLEYQIELCQTLTVKELNANDELQELRKELIQSWENPSSRDIGLKRMGEIDDFAFRNAINEEAIFLKHSKVEELSSFWQNKIFDSEWYPFKIQLVEGSEDHEEVIDPEDEHLSLLRMHLGDEACEVVISALEEMNEYNPSGRFPVLELWNFAENRKATLKEAFSHLNIQRKRPRTSSSNAGSSFSWK